jgi:replicative DNA helicase
MNSQSDIAHPVIDDTPRNKLTSPHAVEAEQALLGALLLNNDLFNDLDGTLRSEHFYDKRHQLIFKCIQELALNQHADPILLTQRLQADDRLREAGGAEYIAAIADSGAAAVNVSAYAELVRDMALLRQMAQVLSEAAAEVYHPGDKPPLKLLDEAESRLAAIGGQFAGEAAGMRLAGKEAESYLNRMIPIIQSKNFDALRGAPTGYPKLDKMTNGLHGGDLVIIAGRPGAGKTAFSLNVARHVSATGGGVVFFSLEMSVNLLVMRLISQDGLDANLLRTGKHWDGRAMDGDDLRKFTESVSTLGQRNIYIEDRGALNILEARSMARRARRQLSRDGCKLSLIVVDYLQLMSAGGDGVENRVLEVSAVSRGLKALAKELNVPVVALSQLNRSVDVRPNKEPVLSDLRESGAIEQDADLVLFLHEKTDESESYGGHDSGTKVKLIIGKQRNGPTGTVPLIFDKKHTRFAQATEEHDSFDQSPNASERGSFNS